MEGVLREQNESFIGLTCWGKFNASIQANRMSKEWRWIDAESGEFGSHETEDSDFVNGDMEWVDDVDNRSLSGYWIDKLNKRIRGKVLFRIKDFDVGISGDHSFLSIEGTMLGDKQERQLREAEILKAKKTRQQYSGILHKERRNVPEFSVTDFGREVDEDLDEFTSKQSTWKASRPPSRLASSHE
jgi:DNA-directed RNA polymerase I subunit RPA43